MTCFLFWTVLCSFVIFLFPQPRTAHAPPVLVPTVGPVWEEETPSPASAKKAGKAPPVARVSSSSSLFTYLTHKNPKALCCDALWGRNTLMIIWFLNRVLSSGHLNCSITESFCFFSSTDTNDCNPHPWWVSFPAPSPSLTPISMSLPPSSPHFTQTSGGEDWEGVRWLKAVEVVLKSSLKGASQHGRREGASEIE